MIVTYSDYPGNGMSLRSIFKTTRRGLMGSKDLDADYMNRVNDRVRRMKAAMRDQDQPVNNRQTWLPGF